MFWSKGRSKVFRNFEKNPSILCLIFPAVWDTNTSISHCLHVYRGEVSGQMLLILAASWHYWYIPVKWSWCNRTPWGQCWMSWGSHQLWKVMGCTEFSQSRQKPPGHHSLVIPSQLTPAFLQLIAVHRGYAGFPVRRRGDKLLPSPCPGGAFLGWRHLTGVWSSQMLRSIWAKTTNTQGLQR